MSSGRKQDGGTGVAREDVRIRSGGDELAVWLYRPDRAGPHPLVVMAHGLGGVRTMGLEPYAERFAAAGIACLLFDYRRLGDSGAEPRQLVDLGAQREDFRAAVAWARQLDDVAADRIALWGTSLGGGHVIRTAAADSRVAAAVVQCPFTDGPASVRATGARAVSRLTGPALRDLLAALRGRAPVTVPIAGEPGSTALMTTDDAWSGVQALIPPGSDVRIDVAARFALRLPFDRPGRYTRRVRCPILFCVCANDSVAPASATLRHAARARRGQVALYDIGHFDIYRGSDFEQAVADQLAFLRRELGV